MGKKSKGKKYPPESVLVLPTHPSLLSESSNPPLPEIIDTHTHLLSTFSAYRVAYPDGAYEDVWAFVRGLYSSHRTKDGNFQVANGSATTEENNATQNYPVAHLVDVWCEAPVTKAWKELADSADPSTSLPGTSVEDVKSKWGGVEYWFVMGVHPHEAKHYTSEVESDILASLSHPRSLGIGEIGLDYHYTNSPVDVQQHVLRRQLEIFKSHSLSFSSDQKQKQKALVIHTREAEEDTERILKEVLGSETVEERARWKIHVHCFTDSPAFAKRLLDYFPGLYIGITGVITYATNANTSQLIREMVAPSSPTASGELEEEKNLRILLETDAPYMVPSNLYTVLGKEVKGRLPICHTGMIPWTAEWVAGVINGGDGGTGGSEGNGTKWDTARVLRVARENAGVVYGL